MAKKNVKIKTATIDNRRKLVPSDYSESCEIKNYTVLCNPTESNPYYMILIDDDMVGWTVSNFHILHYDLPIKFLGKKFFDVTDRYFT